MSFRNIIITIAAACFTGCNHAPVQTQGTESGQSASVENNEIAPKAADANEGEAASCGATTLNAADAGKWDCVPEIGFWCTDPAGCLVEGNLAKVGTRFSMVLPIPQGTHYEFLPVDMDGYL